ncbi:unnamed protein product [Ixodes pacificus]
MATEANQDAPLAIGATAVLTLPKFWAEDPALWFVQVENKFRLHRITSQIRQYELLIDALPPQAATEVRDILLSPLGDTPYDTLKEALVSRLVASEQRRLQQLLSAEELGDRRPSQFLRHLQHLLGDKAASIDAAILRELFLQRLPPPVRVGLAVAHRLPLLELAELADLIMEVNSPTIGATQRTSDLTSDIAELRKAMEKLTAEVSELRRESSQRARSTGRRSRDRAGQRFGRDSSRRPSPSPPSSAKSLCRYHRQFGSEARHCRPPCSWDQGNGMGGR